MTRRHGKTNHNRFVQEGFLGKVTKGICNILTGYKMAHWKPALGYTCTPGMLPKVKYRRITIYGAAQYLGAAAEMGHGPFRLLAAIYTDCRNSFSETR